MSKKNAISFKLLQVVSSKATAITLATLTLLNLPACAQPPGRLTINEVYALGRSNYPLIKQRSLISRAKDYSVSNAAKGYLPSISVSGQATYQSAVTNFPFQIPVPGFTLPHYSKDQYKVYAEADQVVYDGGLIKNQKQVAEVNEIINQQSLDVQLYALYDRLDQLFFGAILLTEQLKQNDLLQKDIKNGVDKAKALVTNGLAYRSSVNELTAQLLQAEQLQIQLQTAKKAYLQMLSAFINRTVDENTKLEADPVPISVTDSITRPEILLFEYQKKTYDLQDQQLKVQLRPHLGLFVQGGYGRPGLNPLNNDFAAYYIGGIRLSWSLGSLYTLKNQHQLLNLSRQTLDVQKQTFVFNTRQAQTQQSAVIEQYAELIKRDNAIINLRHAVKDAATAQLQNGVLSAHDYLSEVNAEDEARQNLILHQVQLLQAQYSYQNTIGNINSKK